MKKIMHLSWDKFGAICCLMALVATMAAAIGNTSRFKNKIRQVETEIAWQNKRVISALTSQEKLQKLLIHKGYATFDAEGEWVLLEYKDIAGRRPVDTEGVLPGETDLFGMEVIDLPKK